MTSPFVDRVEYQVIGRDVNASGVFRDVADAAGSAGDSINGLGNDLDRVNRSIDDTANRMRELVSSLQDLSATRQITVTTNVNEVLGSVADNRQVLDLLNDRFENLTVNVIATVDQLVSLNDGITTIDDNRTAITNLGDNVLQLTQNVDATVDSVVNLNDGLQTINDNRTAIVTLDGDVVTLTQSIDATVDSVVSLSDGIQTIDDNRTAVIAIGDDVRALTQNIDATVDSVVSLNDGITTIDDNRNVIVTVDDDFRTLSQSITATVDSVVSLNDGITTIDDNRNVIVTVDDDFRTLTQDVNATVNSMVDLNDGITTIDDNRTAITRFGDDFRNIGDDIDNTRLVIIRFNDEVANVDDNRNGISDLGNGFDDLSTAIERSRGRVVDLNSDLNNLPAGNDINRDIDINRRVVETVSSDRDRWERAGLVAGGAFLHTFLSKLSNGLDNIPIVGPMLANITRSLAALSAPVTAAVIAMLAGVAVAAAGVVANAFTAGILGALGGGVLFAGFIAAFADPSYKSAIHSLGAQIKDTFKQAVMSGGEGSFAHTMALAIGTIQTALGKDGPLQGLLDDLFQNAAGLIKPLSDGMIGFATNVLPGVSVAIKNMKPIFDQLGVWLPKLGKTVGDFFAKLSTQSPQLASALGYVLGFVDTAIKFIGGLLIGLAKLEPAFEDVLHAAKVFFDFVGVVKPGFAIIDFLQNLWWLLGVVRDVLTVAVDGVGMLGDSFARLAAPLGGVVGLLGRLAGPMSTVGALAGITGGALGLFGGKSDEAGSKASGFGSKVSGAASALAHAATKADIATASQDAYSKAINDSINAANDFIRGKDQVAAAYDAMDRAAKHLADTNAKDLKKGIDLTTQAGRDNWSVLRDIASTANGAAGQIADMGGTTEDVAAVLRTARQKFLDTAGAMGITGQRAVDLANQMFGIPDVDPQVTLQDKASKGIGNINGKLGSLDRYNAMPSVGLLDNASRGIGHIQNLLYRIDGDSATVTVNVRQNGSVSNPLQYAASGGPVYGPGPKGVDSKLYMLAPGEHILTAREVDAAGGHAAVTAFRRSLLNKANPPRVGTTEDGLRSGRSGGRGIDAQTLRQALSGMTLVIDDRTGRTAQLIARGG